MFNIIILVLLISSTDGGVAVEQIRVGSVEECNSLLTRIQKDHKGMPYRVRVKGYCIEEQP